MKSVEILSIDRANKTYVVILYKVDNQIVKIGIYRRLDLIYKKVSGVYFKTYALTLRGKSLEEKTLAFNNYLADHSIKLQLEGGDVQFVLAFVELGGSHRLHEFNLWNTIARKAVPELPEKWVNIDENYLYCLK